MSGTSPVTGSSAPVPPPLAPPAPPAPTSLAPSATPGSVMSSDFLAGIRRAGTARLSQLEQSANKPAPVLATAPRSADSSQGDLQATLRASVSGFRRFVRDDSDDEGNSGPNGSTCSVQSTASTGQSATTPPNAPPMAPPMAPSDAAPKAQEEVATDAPSAAKLQAPAGKTSEKLLESIRKGKTLKSAAERVIREPRITAPSGNAMSLALLVAADLIASRTEASKSSSRPDRDVEASEWDLEVQQITSRPVKAGQVKLAGAPVSQVSEVLKPVAQKRNYVLPSQRAAAPAPTPAVVQLKPVLRAVTPALPPVKEEKEGETVDAFAKFGLKKRSSVTPTSSNLTPRSTVRDDSSDSSEQRSSGSGSEQSATPPAPRVEAPVVESSVSAFSFINDTSSSSSAAPQPKLPPAYVAVVAPLVVTEQPAQVPPAPVAVVAQPAPLPAPRVFVAPTLQQAPAPVMVVTPLVVAKPVEVAAPIPIDYSKRDGQAVQVMLPEFVQKFSKVTLPLQASTQSELSNLLLKIKMQKPVALSCTTQDQVREAIRVWTVIHSSLEQGTLPQDDLCLRVFATGFNNLMSAGKGEMLDVLLRETGKKEFFPGTAQIAGRIQATFKQMLVEMQQPKGAAPAQPIKQSNCVIL